MEKEKELFEALTYFFNQRLERLILSNPREKDGFIKLTARPVAIRGELLFQIEEFTAKQAFQKNLPARDAVSYVLDQLSSLYRNGELTSKDGGMNVLIGKKGTVTLKVKRKSGSAKAPLIRAGQAERGRETNFSPEILAHNRPKQYVLPEGTPVPFLVELGVMTSSGAVVKAKYDKFRQINRFLEFVEDILPKLARDRENTIIDFGCGKSYLTFALYYYLKEIKGYPIQIIGLDLKKDVIELCSRLSETFGFDKLKFYQGDIAGYQGVSSADMVVTLHACDTATDYALEKAVLWGARVILSVPCCQHELNRQIENRTLAPVLCYGLLKERISALMTDGIRARLLECAGYRTQLLEFIDMEHTPKNIMIRAVRQGGGDGRDGKALCALFEEYHLNPTLYQLLKKDRIIEF